MVLWKKLLFIFIIFISFLFELKQLFPLFWLEHLFNCVLLISIIIFCVMCRTKIESTVHQATSKVHCLFLTTLCCSRTFRNRRRKCWQCSFKSTYGVIYCHPSWLSLAFIFHFINRIYSIGVIFFLLGVYKIMNLYRSCPIFVFVISIILKSFCQCYKILYPKSSRFY